MSTLVKTEFQARVLAIDPTSRGFGYVVMEGPGELVDWGLKEARESKNAHCLRQIRGLVERYAPTVILIEDYREPGARRQARVRALLERVAVGPWRGALVVRLTRPLVKQAFAKSGAATRDEIASAVARNFPELASRLPGARRTWMSPNPGLAVFNAAALALTYFRFVHSEARSLL